MTTGQPLTARLFLERFFGEANELNLEDPRLVRALQPWTQRVLERKDRILLPRQESGTVTWYALTDTARSARAFREELIAAVGPSYTGFVGVGAALRRSDPVEAAILEFFGRHAFKLVVVDPMLKDACRHALARMLTLHDRRPPSQVRAPRIPGIILRDIELALQQRDRQAADAAIEELRAGGYLDAQNLRFLAIRRWEALGEWAAIREEVEAGTILELRRPARITQALLRALYQLELVDFEEGVRVSEALAHFEHTLLARVSSLMETREGMSAPEVAKLFMLKAAATRDPALRDAVLEGSPLRGADRVYLRALAELVRSPEATRLSSKDSAIEAYLDGDKDRAFKLLLAGRGGKRRLGLLLRCAVDLGTLRVAEIALEEVGRLPSSEREALEGDQRLARLLRELEERYTAPSLGVPKGWMDWFDMVADGVLDDNKAANLAQQGAEEWSLDELVARPGDIVKLAEAVRRLGERGVRQLRFALPHLQGFLMSAEAPAPPLKPLLRSLLEFHVLDGVPSGGAWRAAADLLESIVRCGLTDDEYADVVDHMEVLLERGLPNDRVDEALDLLEALVVLVPGHGETVRAAALVHGGLERWRRRLSRAQVELFNQLGSELGTGIALPQPPEEREDTGHLLAWLEGKFVALYSLNERALARVSDVIQSSVAGVRVATFHDKVGSAALREAARTADIFLVVTGAAKHAATTFIEANRGEGLLTLHSHGKGSASMVRALETAALNNF